MALGALWKFMTTTTKSSKYFFFYGGILSQWYIHTFLEDGIAYNCAEQYMMAKKALEFSDYDSFEKIMNASTPKEQKALGRRVKGFVEKVWNEKSEEYVFRANLSKFADPRLKRLLLETESKILVEASPFDHIWGIGLSATDPRRLDESQWRGENRLGKVLIRVRDYYLEQQP